MGGELILAARFDDGRGGARARGPYGSGPSPVREHHKATEWPGPEDPVFPSLAGTALQQSNLRRRVLNPAIEEAGCGWAGFHTLRHTCASPLFERGRNVVHVQRWLGHHSPAFTLSTHVHLLPDDVAEPLMLDVELAQGGITVAAAVESGNDVASSRDKNTPGRIRLLMRNRCSPGRASCRSERPDKPG